MELRNLTVVLVVALACAGCSSARQVDSDAVSVRLSTDLSEAVELQDDLVLANGEPSTSGGLLRGIQRVFGRVMPDGTHIVDIELDDAATEADVTRLRDRAEMLGLEDLTWLNDGDPWPWCAGLEDCVAVGETLG